MRDDRDIADPDFIARRGQVEAARAAEPMPWRVISAVGAAGRL